MTDKDFADMLDARDRLLARGYTKVECDKCNGQGMTIHPEAHNPPRGYDYIPCFHCNQKGYLWVGPITK